VSLTDTPIFGLVVKGKGFEGEELGKERGREGRGTLPDFYLD